MQPKNIFEINSNDIKKLEEFICPISLCLFYEPVTIGRHTFEKTMIEKILRTTKINPITQKLMTENVNDLQINNDIKSKIDYLINMYPFLKEEQYVKDDINNNFIKDNKNDRDIIDDYDKINKNRFVALNIGNSDNTPNILPRIIGVFDNEADAISATNRINKEYPNLKVRYGLIGKWIPF